VSERQLIKKIIINNKQMNKILKSLAAIVAVGAVAGGATFAYFSDTATITGNTFTAGTMDLRIDKDPNPAIQDWNNGFANPYNPFANVKPGDAGKQIIDIKNVGTVNGNATIQFDTTTWSALGDNLDFVVEYKLENDTVWAPVASGPLTAWNHNVYKLGALNAGAVGNVKIDWSVPTSAGNDIQSKSITLDTVFGLNQSVPVSVTSNVLHMSSTGAGGWSCPATTPKVVSYTLTTGGQDIAGQGIFKSGATAAGMTWPNTSWGYNYGAGEEGVVVKNGQIGQDVTINLICE
jgi:spore coat-associated protein N